MDGQRGAEAEARAAEEKRDAASGPSGRWTESLPILQALFYSSDQAWIEATSATKGGHHGLR